MKELRVLLFIALAMGFVACGNEDVVDEPTVSASGESGASAEGSSPDIITGQARPPEPSPAANPAAEAGTGTQVAAAGADANAGTQAAAATPAADADAGADATRTQVAAATPGEAGTETQVAAATPGEAGTETQVAAATPGEAGTETQVAAATPGEAGTETQVAAADPATGAADANAGTQVAVATPAADADAGTQVAAATPAADADAGAKVAAADTESTEPTKWESFKAWLGALYDAGFGPPKQVDTEPVEQAITAETGVEEAADIPAADDVPVVGADAEETKPIEIKPLSANTEPVVTPDANSGTEPTAGADATGAQVRTVTPPPGPATGYAGSSLSPGAITSTADAEPAADPATNAEPTAGADVAGTQLAAGDADAGAVESPVEKSWSLVGTVAEDKAETLQELQCLFKDFHLVDGLAFVSGSEIFIGNLSSDEWTKGMPEISLDPDSEEWVREGGVPEIILATRKPDPNSFVEGLLAPSFPESFDEQVNWYASKSLPDIFSNGDLPSVIASGLSESRLATGAVDPHYSASATHVTASYIYNDKDPHNPEYLFAAKYINLCSPEDLHNDRCRVRVLYSGEFYKPYTVSGGAVRGENVWYKEPLTAQIYFGSTLLDFSSCSADSMMASAVDAVADSETIQRFP